MLRYHGHFNRDQFLLGPLNESLLKARETLNFEFVSWRREIFVSSAEQDLLILAFSLCLLHRGHNLDPDDSEVLFHLALNHALMRQVRINSKIIDCCVLWNGWFEQWGVSKEAWSMKHEAWNLFARITAKKSFFPLNYCFMDGAPLSIFYCSGISRTLTCFLVYTLSTCWSATTFAFVLIYFEFSAATDNVFLLFLVAVLIPVIFMLWCGTIKRFKVWIVSNSSLKVCFTFISRWRRPWRTSEMHLKWTWINPFFCIF